MNRLLKLTLLYLFPSVLIAQTPTPGPGAPIVSIPSVQALIALAKENNPDYRVAQHRTLAEYARIGPAGALPDPQISFGIHKSPLQHVAITGGHDTYDISKLSGLSGTLPGMTEYSMSVGQGLPWPGKLAAREDVARQSLERSEIGKYETALALESEVMASCLELLVIQTRMELLEAQLNYWKTTEGIINARLDQGGSSTGDAIQAMQEQSRLRLRLLELDNQMQDQKEMLNQLTVSQPDSPIELGTSILNIALPEPPGEVELLNDLKARNPEWLGSMIDIKIADTSVHSAKMDRYPDFWTGAGISKAGSMPIAWRAEFGVTLPIWIGRKQSKVVARAQAERNTAEYVQAGLALTLATKSRERARAWKLADTTIRLYKTELIPQGEAALEILIARFQNGGASFSSMIETLNALLKDRENSLDAVAQIHRIAILQHSASLDAVSRTSTPNSPKIPISDSGTMQMSAHVN